MRKYADKTSYTEFVSTMKSGNVQGITVKDSPTKHNPSEAESPNLAGKHQQ